MSAAVKKIIMDKVIAAVENSQRLPWSKPWKPGHGPANGKSGRAYSGVNVWLCEMSALANGYTSRYWFTKNQLIEMGLSFSGQSPTQIIFFADVSKKTPDGEEDSYRLLKFYAVWNADQIPGALDHCPKPEDKPEIKPIDAAATLVSRMPNAPKIQHAGSRAFYRPMSDDVTMPPMQDFKTSEGYYSTLFHELGHSTGHKSRLARFTPETVFAPFGSADYSKEELIAELTAVILCGDTGIEPDYNNSAAYLTGWLSALKNDTSLLFSAAAAAEKAAAYIKGKNGHDSESDD